MAKRSANEMIHCDVCGEDYSATYKHCPFCEEDAWEARERERGGGREEEYDDLDEYEEDEYEERPVRRKGGKRLGNRRGGGYGGPPSIGKIVSTVLSLVIIAAAIFVVITIIRPWIIRGNVDPNPSEQVTQTPDPGDVSAEPTDPVESEEPEPSTEPTPDGQTATSFTLSYTEFSISRQYPDPVTIQVTFSPAGTTGEITWSSSNPSALTVDQNGRVSAVGPGSAVITATMAGGYSQTCKVYSTIGSDSGPVSTPTQAPSGGLSLSREDFTLNETWPTYTITVTGASGTVTWSTSNSAVATVSAGGTVARVGAGTCTITAKDAAGNTATCIVRCN